MNVKTRTLRYLSCIFYLPDNLTVAHDPSEQLCYGRRRQSHWSTGGDRVDNGGARQSTHLMPRTTDGRRQAPNSTHPTISRSRIHRATMHKDTNIDNENIMKQKKTRRAQNSIDISSPIVARKHKARNKTNSRNSNGRDPNSISALLSEFVTIYRESPGPIRILQPALILALLAVIAEGSAQLAFSPGLHHYPTLPFAALVSPFLVVILILFFRQNRSAARFTGSIFLFFMTIIYPQVNSELAANPTQQLDIIIFYRIYLYSLIALAVICVRLYALSSTPEKAGFTSTGKG